MIYARRQARVFGKKDDVSCIKFAQVGCFLVVFGTYDFRRKVEVSMFPHNLQWLQFNVGTADLK